MGDALFKGSVTEAWLDGFETGNTVGQTDATESLLGFIVMGLAAGVAYLAVKGFSEYLTERWADDNL